MICIEHIDKANGFAEREIRFFVALHFDSLPVENIALQVMRNGGSRYNRSYGVRLVEHVHCEHSFICYGLVVEKCLLEPNVGYSDDNLF